MHTASVIPASVVAFYVITTVMIRRLIATGITLTLSAWLLPQVWNNSNYSLSFWPLEQLLLSK
jgi:hypothetical protein